MAKAIYTWGLRASQHHGNLYLEWSSNAPFRPEDGLITVYKNAEFPADPRDEVKKSISDTSTQEPWDTGLPWGSDWYCAYIAKNLKGDYAYNIQLITMGASKPESNSAE